MFKHIEYRVKPVTRWIVTKHLSIVKDGGANIENGGSVGCGEFDSQQEAFEVASALGFKEKANMHLYGLSDKVKVKFPDNTLVHTD